MKAAGFDKFFRNYSERAVRGHGGRDPWVAVRSPFEPVNMLEQDTLPNIFEPAQTPMDDASYEVAQPSSVLTDAGSAFMTGVTGTEEALERSTSLPGIKESGTRTRTRRAIQDYGKDEAYYFGTEGKQFFVQHLELFERNYLKTERKMRKDDRLWTPRQLYLRDCAQKNMVPEMLAIRSSDHQRNDKQGLLNLSTKGIGSARLEALARVLDTMPSVTAFDLSRNRLDDKRDANKNNNNNNNNSLSQIVKALAARAELHTVIFSGNSVSAKAMATLGRCIAGGGFTKLGYLHLSNCGLRDSHIPPDVAQMLSAAPQLAFLDVSDNSLRSGALSSLASVKQASRSSAKPWASLTELNVSGNSFRSADLLALTKALSDDSGCFQRVETLRCSRMPIGVSKGVFHAFGSAIASDVCRLERLEMQSCMLGLSDTTAFEAFGTGLAANTTLVWLDLSHNQIDPEKTMVLGDQLLLNHTLLDFYYRHGNCGRVDNLGFLLPAAIMATSAFRDDPSGRFEDPAADATMRRHFEHTAGAGDANRDYPWRAGQWTETCFQWTPGISGSGTTENVYLRLGADRWWPCPLTWNETSGAFEVWRSLPPGKYKYLFQVGGTKATVSKANISAFEFAEDQLQVPLLDPKLSVFGDMVPQNLLVNQRDIPPSRHAKYNRAPPRPAYAYERRHFDEDEFKGRSTPDFARQHEEDDEPEKKKKKHKKGLIASVFAPRRATSKAASQYYDTPDQYAQAAEADMARMCRGEGLKAILPPDQVDVVRTTLRKRYSLVCHAHRWYSSFGTGSMVAMNMGMFRMFLGKINVMHDRDTKDSMEHASALQRRLNEGKEVLTLEGEMKEKKSYLTENDVVMIFKKAETSVWARKAGDMKNSVGKALDRFEFAEALVRVAVKSFVPTGRNDRRSAADGRNRKRNRSSSRDSDAFAEDGGGAEGGTAPPKDAGEALDHLLSNFVDRYADRSSGNEFRKKYLYISGVDSLLRHRMHLLKSVYHHFSAMFSHGQGRQTLSFKEWDTLVKSAFKYKPKSKLLGAAMLDLMHAQKEEEEAKARAEAVKVAEEERKQKEADEEKRLAAQKRKTQDEANLKKMQAEADGDGSGDGEGGSFMLGLDPEMDGGGGGMFDAGGGDFDGDAWGEEGGGGGDSIEEEEQVFDFDGDDEATARAVERIQNAFRRRIATMRTKELRDDKAARLAQLREATKPLEQSKGVAGDAAPAGAFQRRNSLRSDVLLVSKELREEQDRMMESGSHKDSTLIGGLTDLDVRQAFSFSQMLRTDELVDETKGRLAYCDFLEGLVRLAQIISQTQAVKEGIGLEQQEQQEALGRTYYDADGVLRSEKMGQSKYGKYETVGMTALDIEEKKMAREMEHLARMEFVLDKVTHLTETMNQRNKRR